jgi:serine/threonine protein phosphatase 1
MADRLFAIGDVHGNARELEALLTGLRPGRGDTVAFVGDYVDRGPDSAQVIDLLLDLQRSEAATIFLKGNHEDMALAYLGSPGHWGEAWLLNGGGATLRSYGLPPDAQPSEARAVIPAAHIAFLEALEPWRRLAGHVLVHAGIRPGVPMAEQQDTDLFWIREEFTLHPHDLAETVVFGHTPSRTVFVDLPYKIGIDTGCVYGGTLTALDLHEHVVHQVRHGERRMRTRTLSAART